MKEIPIDNQTFVKPSTPTNTENIGHEIQNETPFPFEAETPIIKTPIIQNESMVFEAETPTNTAHFWNLFGEVKNKTPSTPSIKVNLSCEFQNKTPLPFEAETPKVITNIQESQTQNNLLNFKIKHLY